GGTPADAIGFTRLMERITLARNSAYGLPSLGFSGTPTGIDARRVVETGVAPVINTGIAHRQAGVGQIGAGIARAPLACFELAVQMSSAASRGGIGQILAMALLNELSARGLRDRVAYVLTHTVVDPADPAFENPTKPIGPFYTESQAATRRRRSHWQMIEDSGRGYRRVVPSPKPVRIVESAQI